DPSPDHEFMSRLGRGAFRPDRDGPAGIHEGRGFDRKLDDERVTGAPARLDTDSAAVQPRRPLHEHEAETAARPIDLPRPRRLVERWERASALLCRGRRRPIVTPKLAAPARADGGDPDAASRRGELARVLAQVRGNPPQETRVPAELDHPGGLDLDVDRPARR